MTTPTPKKGTASKTPSKTSSRSRRPPADWSDRNPDLRRRFLELEKELANAGSPREVRRIQHALDDIGREFVAINRGLIVSEAKRFNRNTVDDHDNTRAAELGLWEAFMRFDPDRGVAFSTFSRQFIAGGVQRSVRRNEFQHLTQGEFNLRKQLRLAESQLMVRLGHHPSWEELSTHTGVALEKIEKILALPMASLDAPVGGEEDLLLGDRLSAAVAEFEEEEDVEAHLECLNDMDLWVLSQRIGLFGAPQSSLVDVSDTIGIGREVVRRAETRARVRLTASAMGDRLARLAEPAEVADLLGTDVKSTTSLLSVSYDDIRDRWLRLQRMVADAPEAQRSFWESRIDRCGEEFMQEVSPALYQAAGRLLDKAGHPIGVKAAANLLWEAFLSWDPDRRTYPRHLRRCANSRYERSETLVPQRQLPPDELWYLVDNRRPAA